MKNNLIIRTRRCLAPALLGLFKTPAERPIRLGWDGGGDRAQGGSKITVTWQPPELGVLSPRTLALMRPGGGQGCSVHLTQARHIIYNSSNEMDPPPSAGDGRRHAQLLQAKRSTGASTSLLTPPTPPHRSWPGKMVELCILNKSKEIETLSNRLINNIYFIWLMT